MGRGKIGELARHLRGMRILQAQHMLEGAMIRDTKGRLRTWMKTLAMVVPALWGISSFDDLMKKGGYEYSRSTDKASLVVGGATFNYVWGPRLSNFKIRPHTDWHGSFKGFSTSSEDA